MEELQESTAEGIEIINIPKIAFRSFIDIADKNRVNGKLVQTLCYLLGPRKKSIDDETWIDTVVIPKQTGTDSTVEDDGIEEKDTFTYLKELSFSKEKNVIAWVHTRPPGPNNCEFTSIDMHTQFALTKYVSKDIIGIIIELQHDQYIWNAMNLNIYGEQRVEFCGKKNNCPFDVHKWCACDCLYESCKSSIKLGDKIPIDKNKVMLANFMVDNESENSRWNLAEEDNDEPENPDDEVSCEYCNEKLLQCTILKHIGHKEACKSHYGPRFEEMKRKKNKDRKRKSRQKLGTGHELKQQKEARNEKEEKMMVQFHNIPKVDRENVIHWKLAQEYCKDMLKNHNLEKELNYDAIKNDIEQLYNRFRLDIRGLHMKIKK